MLGKCHIPSQRPKADSPQLGKVESDDTVNDVDDGLSRSPQSSNARYEPIMPPPPPKDFDELPLLHQFTYTIPVLQAIINNEYEPTKDLHEHFKRGGTARIRLKQKSPSIGQMKETIVRKLWELVDHWALGVETRIVNPNSSTGSADDHPVGLNARHLVYLLISQAGTTARLA